MFDIPPDSSSPQHRRTLRARRRRRGATLVEVAVVAPVAFLLILAMFEFGRMMMVEHIITNAAREGARRGILEQATPSEVRTIVTDYLAGCSISGATVTVSPEQFKHLGFGDPVTVTVSVPFDQVSWLPAPWLFGGENLRIESMMRAERVE